MKGKKRKMSQLEKYLQLRKKEVQAALDPKHVPDSFVESCYEFIEYSIEKRFGEEITPDSARKIELLEILLVSFIQHCLEPDMLNEIQTEIDTFRAVANKGLGLQ
jgi:hypothetical protein